MEKAFIKIQNCISSCKKRSQLIVCLRMMYLFEEQFENTIKDDMLYLLFQRKYDELNE